MSTLKAVQEMIRLVQDNPRSPLLLRRLVEAERLAKRDECETEALKSWCRDIVRFKAHAVRRSEAYWVAGDETPFCSPCFEREGYLIHLFRKPDGYRCGICGNQILDSKGGEGFRVLSAAGQGRTK